MTPCHNGVFKLELIINDKRQGQEDYDSQGIVLNKHNNLLSPDEA